MKAAEVIRQLGLVPHPEGGHYKETFRDPAVTSEGRSNATAIYFLLDAGETSRWHRVDASEFWLWHAGAALRLSIAEPGRSETTIALGPDLAAGQRPQAVVPAHAWQRAAAGDDGWALVTCVVAPGFEFSGFEMAPPGFSPPSDGG